MKTKILITLISITIIITTTGTIATIYVSDTAYNPIERISCESNGGTYEMIGENETSKNYLEKAIPIFEELGDKRGIGVMYQSMASLSTGDAASRGVIIRISAVRAIDLVVNEGLP